MNLLELEKSQRARVSNISEQNPDLALKLREIGFAEGDEVEVKHYGPLAKRPICVRLNQTFIALRSEEAEAILIETDAYTDAKAAE